MPYLRRLFLFTLPLLLLSGCVQALGPRQVLISQEQLQQKLATMFPVQRKILEVFSVVAEVPTVSMLPAAKRVATSLRVTVSDRLSGKDFLGVMTASFALRFDPDAMALKLVDVRVDALDVDGLSPTARVAIKRLGNLIAGEKLEGFVLYRLRPQDVRQADQLGYTVGAIEITASGIAVNLVPRAQ